MPRTEPGGQTGPEACPREPGLEGVQASPGGGSTGQPRLKGNSREKVSGAAMGEGTLAEATSAGQAGSPGTKRCLRPQAPGQSQQQEALGPHLKGPSAGGALTCGWGQDYPGTSGSY